jgi:cell division GTPase FtsZ
MLRPMILTISGKSGDEEVIAEAKKRFERHIKGDLIDPNIRGAVYVLVSRYGDEKTQEELRKVKEIHFKRPQNFII